MSRRCGASCSQCAKNATCAARCCWPTAPRRATSGARRRLAIERLPALLKQTARETPAFRNKLQRLADEMRRLGDLISELPLPALDAEVAAARDGLESLQAMPEPTGDELLPIIPLIDAVLTTLRSAAPIADDAPLRSNWWRTIRRPTNRASSRASNSHCSS